MRIVLAAALLLCCAPAGFAQDQVAPSWAAGAARDEKF